MAEYKFLEHTADIKFQASGKSLEDAFKSAALALRETIADKIKIKPSVSKKIKIKGRDIKALLYNFLEEFLFLLDAEDFLLSRIKNIKINQKDNKLEAELLGDKADNYRFTNHVKAVTYSEMFVKKEKVNRKNKWAVQVVLDV